MQAKVQSRSDIFLPPCSAEALCFAPHILSLILPVHVWSAADMDMAPSMLAIIAMPKCFIDSPFTCLLRSDEEFAGLSRAAPDAAVLWRGQGCSGSSKNGHRRESRSEERRV